MGLKNTKNALAHAGAKDPRLWMLKFVKKIVKTRPRLLKKSAEITKPVSKMSGTTTWDAQLDASLLINRLTVKQPVRKKVPQPRRSAKKATKLATKKSMKCTKNALLDASLVASPLTARQRAIKKLPLPSKTAKRVTKNATRRSKICIKNAPCPVKRTKF